LRKKKIEKKAKQMAMKKSAATSSTSNPQENATTKTLAAQLARLDIGKRVREHLGSMCYLQSVNSQNDEINRLCLAIQRMLLREREKEKKAEKRRKEIR
jgi:hypothetical protein